MTRLTQYRKIYLAPEGNMNVAVRENRVTSVSESKETVALDAAVSSFGCGKKLYQLHLEFLPQHRCGAFQRK